MPKKYVILGWRGSDKVVLFGVRSSLTKQNTDDFDFELDLEGVKGLIRNLQDIVETLEG